jgi:hypothetical protein
VEEDIPAYPPEVRVLGASAIVARPDGFTNTVEEARRGRVGRRFANAPGGPVAGCKWVRCRGERARQEDQRPLS